LGTIIKGKVFLSGERSPLWKEQKKVLTEREKGEIPEAKRRSRVL